MVRFLNVQTVPKESCDAGENASIPEAAWVLFDGECDLCKSAVQRVQRRDKKRQFRFSPFQSVPKSLIPDAIRGECRRELKVRMPGGTWISGARASLYLLELTGWGAFARLLARPPAIWVASVVYWLIARLRRVLFVWPRRSHRDIQ